MAFGLKVIGDSDTIQVEENNFNLSYISKTTLSSISAATFQATYISGTYVTTTGNIFWVVDYNAANYPLIAFTIPSGRTVYHMHCFNETNTGSPPAAGYARLILWSPGTTAASITVYTFDKTSSGIATSGMGFQVRNASSQLVFRNDVNPIRIVASATLRASTVGTTISKNSSKTYAYNISNIRNGYYYPSSATARRPYVVGLTNTSTTVSTIASTPAFSGEAGDAGGNLAASGLQDNWPLPLYMIDVTNL